LWKFKTKTIYDKSLNQASTKIIIFENLFSKIIICLLLNILTLRHKNGIYLFSYKNTKVLLKIQWIFVILLSFFVIRYFRGACSSVEMLKGYMVRERLGIPVLKAPFRLNYRGAWLLSAVPIVTPEDVFIFQRGMLVAQTSKWTLQSMRV